MDVKKLLDRSKNPFFEHAEAEYFLATRNGEVVGRIAAISNKLHNQVHEDTVGFWGFFESIYDHAVADALFAEAGKWLKARGHDVMRGPMSFSTNDECGLLVDGYAPDPHGDTNAGYVLGERLGVADGLGMPTHPGSAAWLVAVGESIGDSCHAATHGVHSGHGSTDEGHSGGGEGERSNALRDRQGRGSCP